MRPMEQRPSGLVVPKEKPPEPDRQYHPLEITDPEKRKQARKALDMLSDAMELMRGPGNGIGQPGETAARWQANYDAFGYIGQMLLGEDAPEPEIWT